MDFKAVYMEIMQKLFFHASTCFWLLGNQEPWYDLATVTLRRGGGWGHKMANLFCHLLICFFFKQWQNNLKAVHHYDRLKLRAIYSNVSNSHATLSITTLLSRGWQHVGRLRTGGLKRVYDHYGSQRGAAMQLVQKEHMLWDFLPVKRVCATSRLWLKWRWLFSVHSVWQRRET